MEIVKTQRASGRTDFFSKMKKVIDFACEGYPDCDPLELETALLPLFRNGITTKEIQRLLIQVAAEKTSMETPDWQFVAAKLYVYDLYKEAGGEQGVRAFWLW